MVSCAAIWIAIIAIAPSPEVVALGAGGGIITATLFMLIQSQQMRLRGLAETDTLTRLVNHGSFHDALARMFATAARDGSSFALVALDLDNFKQVNDTHGHPYGDSILRDTGERLRASVRSTDVAARVGGEEFAVLLRGTNADLAEEIAERIRADLAAIPLDGGHLECSAGVAVYPDDAGDPDALLECADAALYRAKHAGKAQTRRLEAA